MTEWKGPALKLRKRVLRQGDSVVNRKAGASRLGRGSPVTQIGLYAEAMGLHITDANQRIEAHKAALKDAGETWTK